MLILSNVLIWMELESSIVNVMMDSKENDAKKILVRMLFVKMVFAKPVLVFVILVILRLKIFARKLAIQIRARYLKGKIGQPAF